MDNDGGPGGTQQTGGATVATPTAISSRMTHNSDKARFRRSGRTEGKGKNFLQRKNINGKNTNRKTTRDDRRILSDGSDPTNSAPENRSSHKPGRRKRFQRRREKRDKPKWKPYHMLSFEEKRKIDERETKRAEERRTQLTTLGFPQAPYNTTQFLMEDHKSEHYQQYDDTGNFSSEESSPPPEGDGTLGLDRGYDEEWTRILTSSLNSLSKEKLIERIVQMEQEKTVLEQRVKVLEREVEDLQPKATVSEYNSDEGALITVPGDSESLSVVVDDDKSILDAHNMMEDSSV